MGVVTVSSSASRSPLGLDGRFLTFRSPVRKPFFVAFKTDSNKNSSFITTQESISIPVDSVKEPRGRSKRSKKNSKKVKAVSIDEAPSCTRDMDYNAVAAALESIYILSPDDLSDLEKSGDYVQRHLTKRKGTQADDGEPDAVTINVVRNRRKKKTRLSLDKRIALRRNGDVLAIPSRRKNSEDASGDVDRLVRDYSASTDLVSLDWKKMKIPAVLPSSEHTWLFKLMQPMKAILETKGSLLTDLEREPTDGELAGALNMSVPELRRHLEVGRAARNKLIKHNLRLILFVINKYYQDFGNGPKFQDLCQAGVKGLITAIDRFEPKRGFRLSTYGLFWIRHAIIRSMTVSSFARVPFGIESVRQEIQRAKLELMFELERLPTDVEIIARVGLSPNRFQDIMKASKQVLSLHSRHLVTQEEFIKGITDLDGVGGDKHRQPALLRLALDDVLDSLKPKESMVIRQRYGLDGKGDRTLGEIAGNLNISREMVRKHEVKALMKLKHPARVDYLRRHIG